MAPFVYFLRNPQNGLIKIGTTVNLYSRWSYLQKEQGTELELLGVLDGSLPEEQALHQRFASSRVKRGARGWRLEWFRDTPELREYIRQNTHLDTPHRPGRKVKRCVIDIKIDSEVKQQLRNAMTIHGFKTYSDTIDWLITTCYPEVDEVIRQREQRPELIV